MEATLRICSSLDIERALWTCLRYLEAFMPVNTMGLHVYDYGLGCVDSIARAGCAGGESLASRIQLPKGLQEAVKESWVNGVHYVERFGDHEVMRLVAEAFQLDNGSGIVMELMLEGEELGLVSVINDSGEPFDDAHLELIKLLNKPFAVALSNALRYRELGRIKDLIADDNRYLQDELRSIAGEQVVGAEAGLKPVMTLVRQVADLDSPVLLLGETGTGKEVVANAIHNMSGRKNGPFIKMNCGAIPETLIDSELFGHEKNAFTGALGMKRGRFERAHRGTIFLDEIGELPLKAQVRLLRVLQEKELERVGGSGPIKIDVRVIAATHRDLEGMLERGGFREDLYFRIKVFPITIPPLRSRKGDIPVLTQHFIQKLSREMKLDHRPELAPHAMDRLLAYGWPGNVRELGNAIERALIMSRGGPLNFSELQAAPPPPETTTEPYRDGENDSLDLVMARHIEKVLHRCGGKIGGPRGAAAVLGLHPNTLRHRMRKLGIAFGRRAAGGPTRK